MLYQTRVTQVEAVKVSDLLESARESWKVLPEWVRKAYEDGDLLFGRGQIHVHTNLGTQAWEIAKKDYWLVYNPKSDSIDPVSPLSFDTCYEKVKP
jgi:hypothetical protein